MIVRDHEVEEILVALPGIETVEMRRVLRLCAQTGLSVKIVPSLAVGRSSVAFTDLEDMEVADLLGREIAISDVDAVRRFIARRRVLVTGAAGSIGSELCRQIVPYGPSKLILVEMDESRLYETYLQVNEVAPGAAWMSLTDVRDATKLDAVFADKRPEIVIHAAAYKHVPLMEYEPAEAIAANVLGTSNVLEACIKHGVASFTLVSTDKAVQPTSVMGATKRVAEKLTCAAGRRGLPSTIVRFGNVLGSRGSVIPIFEQALRRGDRIRITHPDMTRYFMTIAEAVQLVLQATTMSEGGEIYVLEMGDPVKILDLAQSIIELQGGRAEIEFTGLRPAEKMHEALVMSDESLLPTDSPQILRSSALPFVPGHYLERCAELIAGARGATPDEIRVALGELVPEYSPGGE